MWDRNLEYSRNSLTFPHDVSYGGLTGAREYFHDGSFIWLATGLLARVISSFPMDFCMWLLGFPHSMMGRFQGCVFQNTSEGCQSLKPSLKNCHGVSSADFYCLGSHRALLDSRKENIDLTLSGRNVKEFVAMFNLTQQG